MIPYATIDTSTQNKERHSGFLFFQPVFCIPAAMPFMVRMRVSSSPGAYSLVVLSFTSSEAGLPMSMTSFDR